MTDVVKEKIDFLSEKLKQGRVFGTVPVEAWNGEYDMWDGAAVMEDIPIKVELISVKDDGTIWVEYYDKTDLLMLDGIQETQEAGEPFTVEDFKLIEDE